MENIEAVKLCKLLRDGILKIYPKFKVKNRDQWIKQMTAFIKIEPHTVQEIEHVIAWSRSDPFWSATVTSPSGLRRNFVTMEMRMMSEKQASIPTKVIIKDKVPCRGCSSTTYRMSTDGLCKICYDREEGYDK